jgi:ubiquinone biosynthesis protein COQ9
MNPSPDAPLRTRIVDAALALAEETSWESVRLHALAARLGITLEDIRAHFREKEDIVDAWFDRADAAMLDISASPGFATLGARERIHRLLMGWLEALSTHRVPTRQMILNKLEPGHLHYQFAGAMRVSRTVQWMREAAERDATLPWRAIEETTLTTLYLATFATWMTDASEGSIRTAQWLERRLNDLAPFVRLASGLAVTTGRPDNVFDEPRDAGIDSDGVSTRSR